MRRLEQKKPPTIITARELDKLIIDVGRRHGLGGYTVTQASGAGTCDVQSGMLDIDPHILSYIILSVQRLLKLLDEPEDLMHRGHQLKAIVSDLSILPRKPTDKLSM